MAEITALTHIEHAWQTAFPTAVTPPTIKLALVEPSPKFNPGRPTVLAAEERGAAGNYTAYQEEVNPTASIAMLATYEQIHYPLEWISGTVSPSGTAAPYTRDYAGFLATMLTPRYGTLQFGCATGVYELIGAVGTKLTLTQEKKGSPLRAVATLGGHSMVSGAFAVGPALSDSVVNIILGSHATVYLDAALGTMGATPLTATVDSLSLDIDPQLNWSDYLGSIYHGDTYHLPWKVTLKLSCEFNAGMKTQADAWIGAAWQKLIRVKYTTGSSATLKLFQVDFSGTMVNTPEFFSNKSGKLTMDVELTDSYDATFAHFLKIQTKCATATLL